MWGQICAKNCFCPLVAVEQIVKICTNIPCPNLIICGHQGWFLSRFKQNDCIWYVVNQIDKGLSRLLAHLLVDKHESHKPLNRIRCCKGKHTKADEINTVLQTWLTSLRRINRLVNRTSYKNHRNNGVWLSDADNSHHVERLNKIREALSLLKNACHADQQLLPFDIITKVNLPNQIGIEDTLDEVGDAGHLESIFSVIRPYTKHQHKLTQNQGEELPEQEFIFIIFDRCAI